MTAAAGTTVRVPVDTDAKVVRWTAPEGLERRRPGARRRDGRRPGADAAGTLRARPSTRRATGCARTWWCASERAAAPRPRRAPLGHDAAPRHARPPLGARGPGRVLLRAPARGPAARAIDVDAFVDDLRRLTTLRDWDVSVEDVRARLRPGMPLGEAIARGLRDLRRRPRQGPLGRQDADVHAAPAAARAPLAGRALRPPDPRRPGRCRLVPRDAGGDRHEDLGASRDGRGLRLRVARRGEGGAGARPPRRPGRYLEVRYEALVADPERELERICALRGPPLRARDARLRGPGGRLREAPPAEPQAAADAGASRLADASSAPPTSPRSRRSPATCSRELGYELPPTPHRSLRGRRAGGRGTGCASPRGSRLARALQRSPPGGGATRRLS